MARPWHTLPAVLGALIMQAHQDFKRDTQGWKKTWVENIRLLSKHSKQKMSGEYDKTVANATSIL